MSRQVLPKRCKSTCVLGLVLGLCAGSCARPQAEPAPVAAVEPAADPAEVVSDAPAPEQLPALEPTVAPQWDHAPEGSGYRCAKAAGPEPLPALPVKGQSIVVDPRVCEPASATVALPMGSLSVEVEGVSEGGCDVVVTDEIEGAYTRRRCALPQSKKRVRIEPRQAPSSCTEIETGSDHEDLSDALAKALQTMPVEGTSFTVGVRQDVAGTGVELGEVSVAEFEYRLFEDKGFERPASCDRCSGTVILDVSPDGPLGAGVQGALRAPGKQTQSPIALGGTRSVVVREETAAGLREHLPAMPREAQICVQLTLVGAR